jgi:hypothetical protein
LVLHERFNLVMFCAVPIQVMDFQRQHAVCVKLFEVRGGYSFWCEILLIYIRQIILFILKLSRKDFNATLWK